MSHVRDMSLAESGRMKIRWVQDFMPALVAITGEEFMRILHAAQKEEEHHA